MARSVTEKRGGGKGVVGEQGETDLETSSLDEVLLLVSNDGDRDALKEKLSSNMFMAMMVDRRTGS